MSGTPELSTDLLHEIEASLDWAASEARESAKHCTLDSDTTALNARADSLDNLCATVQGLLRLRHDAQRAKKQPYEFIVRWEIDIEADSPREAAEKALAIHRNLESIATVFDVMDSKGQVFHVDLDEDEA